MIDSNVLQKKVDNIIYCYYFNLKMLLTVDINYMTEVLIREYGSSINITFTEMDEQQKSRNSHKETIFELIAVDKRFELYVHNIKEDTLVRKVLLEEEIIDKGHK